MGPVVFANLAEFAAAAGTPLGVSQWHVITTEMVAQFADATNDHQWIHVDADRAAAGPFGAPIAHGFHLVSMIAGMSAQVYRVEGLSMAVNYGLGRVRFISPVVVGSRVRATATLVDVQAHQSGYRGTFGFTVEIEGQDKLACTAEVIALLF